jgi:hypothetical protein
MRDGVDEAPVLEWREAGLPWHPVVPAPSTTTGFVEGRYVEFRAHASDVALLVDDEPAQSIEGGWSWTPGFFAGDVEAVLVLRGRVIGRFVLDVSPHPAKLGRETFHQMIDELWAFSPELLLGSEPATTPTGELGALEDPWVAFARLRRYGPDVVRALVDVAQRPRRRLRVERGSASVSHVRRVDRTTARSALRTPAAALLRASRDQVAVLPADCRLDVPVVEDTMDCAPNRTLLVMARSVLRRAEVLLETLGDIVAKERASDTTTALGPRWPARRQSLVEILGGLKAVLRREPFSSVRRAEVTAAGLTAVAADPSYARAWSRGWKALRLAGDGTSERLWLSPTWEIYERWCFLALGRALTEQCEWTWKWTDGHRRLVGSRGSMKVELLLQPTFQSSPTPKPGYWSVSRQRVPDIVLRVDDFGASKFFVFDAKYRTSRDAVLDAMASAHIYQDSLRLGHSRPQASVLLVPAGGGAPWLEAPGFSVQHGVGVHAVSVDEQAALADVVARVTAPDVDAAGEYSRGVSQ